MPKLLKLKKLSAIRWYLTTSWRAFYSNIFSELTYIVATAVMTLLFFYIFGDFLGEKILGLPQKAVEASQKSFAFLLFLACSPLLINRLRLDDFKRFTELLESLGLEKDGIARLSLARRVVVVIGLYGSLWLAVSFIFDVGANWLLLCQTFSLILAAILGWIPPRTGRTKSALTKPPRSRLTGMVRWRILQLLRSPVSRLILAFSLTLTLAPSILLDLPEQAAAIYVFLAFGGGFVLSIALFGQIKQDIQSSWFEKLIGVAQEDYIRTYYAVASLFALPFALVLAGLSLSHLQGAVLAKTVISFCVPLAFVPGLMFQVDPRRPGAHILANFMLSLFVVTGIYAHMLAVVLIPLIGYYSCQYQKDLFYRA